MTRFDRYLLAQLSLLFGFFALVMALVFWINRAVSLFDRLIGDGQSFGVFLEFTTLSLPSVIRIAIPVAAFAAAVYVGQRLRADSELVAMQAAGASAARIARPVLAFGLLAALLLSLIVHALLPMSRARLDERQGEVAEDLTARLLTPGAFVHPARGITFYLAELAEDGEMRGIFLEDARRPAERVAYTAERAVLTPGEAGPVLVMFDGLVQSLGAEDGRLATTRFAEFSYDIGGLVSGGGGAPGLRETTTAALLRGAGPEATEDERILEIHRRAAEPALALGAALLGFASVMLGPFSRFGVWRQVLLGIGLLIAVKLVEGVATGEIGGVGARWPLHYAAPVLALALAVIMLALAGGPRRARAPAPPAPEAQPA